MPGICRNNVDLAGVCNYGYPPTNANSGSPNVYVNNNQLHRVGDTFVPHGCVFFICTISPRLKFSIIFYNFILSYLILNIFYICHSYFFLLSIF